MQSAEANRNEMDGGYCDGLKRLARYSSPLVSTKGTIGKLLLRMQSAEADYNEMDGGYCDGLRRFACIHRPWFQSRAILVRLLMKMQSAELIAMKWMVAIAMA